MPRRRQVDPGVYKNKQQEHYWKNREKYIAYNRVKQKEYALAIEEFLCEYLDTHPCIECGETDIVILQFDHVTGKKKAGVTSLSTLNLVKQELPKCVVRCSPCHTRRHAKELNSYRVRWQAKKALQTRQKNDNEILTNELP